MAKKSKSRRYRTGTPLLAVVGEKVADNLKRTAKELELEKRKSEQMDAMWRIHGKFARFIGTRGC